MSFAAESAGPGGIKAMPKGKGGGGVAASSSPRSRDAACDKKMVNTSPPSPRLSPPPLTSPSTNTSTPPERNSSYPIRENQRSPYEDGSLSPQGEGNRLQLRESPKRGPSGTKGQKMCAYELCPSPLHSKKWRIVTAGTNAGGRDWNALVGQTLCDSCYSTYRKHGTFVRSIRTNEGWSRIGNGAGIACKVVADGHADKRDKSDRPKKAQQQQQQQQQQRAQRTPKRSRVHDDEEEDVPGGKRQDRKAAVKSGWWRRGQRGAGDEVERELLEAVAILRSLQSSAPMPEEAAIDCCHEDVADSQQTVHATIDTAAAAEVTAAAHDSSAAAGVAAAAAAAASALRSQAPATCAPMDADGGRVEACSEQSEDTARHGAHGPTLGCRDEAKRHAAEEGMRHASDEDLGALATVRLDAVRKEEEDVADAIEMPRATSSLVGLLSCSS